MPSDSHRVRATKRRQSAYQKAIHRQRVTPSLNQKMFSIADEILSLRYRTPFTLIACENSSRHPAIYRTANYMFVG